MDIESKKFRPFVFIMLAVGLIVALLVLLMYGKLFEEVENEPEAAPVSLSWLVSTAMAAEETGGEDVEEKQEELSPPTDPEAKKAWDLCEGSYRRCMNGKSFATGNPFVQSSCNQARASGRLDPHTWAKCKAWCEKTRESCRQKAVTQS